MAAKKSYLIAKGRRVIPAACLLAAIFTGLIWADLDARLVKRFVLKAAGKHMGRPVHINGPFLLSYFPDFRITANGVTMANPKQMGSDNFLEIDSVQLRIHPWTLLGGSLKMDPIRVSGVRIVFERGSSGRGNWQISGNDAAPVVGALVTGNKEKGERFALLDEDLDIFGKSEAPEASIPSGKTSQTVPGLSGALMKLMALGMTARDLHLELRTEKHRIFLRASEWHVLPEVRRKIKTMGLRFRGVAGIRSLGRGMSSKPGIDVAGRARIELDPAAGQFMLEDIAISLGEIRVEGNLHGRDLFAYDPDFQGAVRAFCSDITRLSKPLEMRAENLSGRQMEMSMGIHVMPSRKESQVSDFRASLLGAEFTGNFGVKGRQAGLPEFGGDIHAAGPDLPGILLFAAGIFSRTPEIEALEANLDRLPDKRFHLDADFDADLHGGRIEIRKLEGRGAGMDSSSKFSTHGLFSLMPKAFGDIRASAKDLPLILAIADRLQGRHDQAQKDPNRWERTGSRALEVDIRMDMDMAWGRILVPEFKICGLGLRLDGQLEARKIGTKKSAVNGRFSLSHDNLKAFLAAFNRTLPVPPDPHVFSAVRVDTAIAATRREWVLKNISGYLDDTRIKGRAVIADPFSQVSLVLDDINLDRYLPQNGETGMPGTHMPGKQRAAPETNGDAVAQIGALLPFHHLRDLDFNADVTVGRMVFSGEGFTGVRMNVDAAHGNISVAASPDK